MLNIYDEVENDPALKALHKVLMETRNPKLTESYMKLRNELQRKVEQRYKGQYGDKAIGELGCFLKVKGLIYPVVYHMKCEADTGTVVYRQRALWQRETMGYGSPNTLIAHLKEDLDTLIAHGSVLGYRSPPFRPFHEAFFGLFGARYCAFYIVSLPLSVPCDDPRTLPPLLV